MLKGVSLHLKTRWIQCAEVILRAEKEWYFFGEYSQWYRVLSLLTQYSDSSLWWFLQYHPLLSPFERDDWMSGLREVYHVSARSHLRVYDIFTGIRKHVRSSAYRDNLRRRRVYGYPEWDLHIFYIAAQNSLSYHGIAGILSLFHGDHGAFLKNSLRRHDSISKEKMRVSLRCDPLCLGGRRWYRWGVSEFLARMWRMV